MPGPIQLLKDSFALVKENLSLLFAILIVPIILSFLVALLAPNPEVGITPALNVIVYFALVVLYMVVSVLMSVALIIVIDKKAVTAKEAYKQSMKYFWRYVGLSILMSIILVIGFLLFIIPGIIMSVWFAFATLILILENSTIVESMKKSREYVRGKWWQILGRLLAMSAFIIILQVLLSMLTLFLSGGVLTEAIISSLSVILAPVSLAYMYVMYSFVRTNPAIIPSMPQDTTA